MKFTLKSSHYNKSCTLELAGCYYFAKLEYGILRAYKVIVSEDSIIEHHITFENNHVSILSDVRSSSISSNIQHVFVCLFHKKIDYNGGWKQLSANEFKELHNKSIQILEKQTKL